MDVLELWEIAERTSHICKIIQFLRDDPGYSRADAANDLEVYLQQYLERDITKAYTKDSPDYECFALQEERRLQELDDANEAYQANI